ncbi:MAG: TIM barrel protein [Litoreibacter sp.]
MTRISANLGFLWTDLSLPDAIRAAATAGFDAVEFHWPYSVDTRDVQTALHETGLPVVGLNTQRGNPGENGLSAIPGRESEARVFIDEACSYAAAIECGSIHVMAGFTDGGTDAEKTFVENLIYACEVAEKNQQTILVEPLNSRDVPRYHMSTAEAALATIQSVGASNIKLMFDCYHLQIMQGDLARLFETNMDKVGHIQIAGVPDRGEPDQGEVDYRWLLQRFDALGWDGYVGAEYRPRTTLDAGLGWMSRVIPGA